MQFYDLCLETPSRHCVVGHFYSSVVCKVRARLHKDGADPARQRHVPVTIWPWRAAPVKASAWLCSIFTIDWSGQQVLPQTKSGDLFQYSRIKPLKRLSRWNTIGWEGLGLGDLPAIAFKETPNALLPFIQPCFFFYHFPILHPALLLCMCCCLATQR